MDEMADQIMRLA